MPHIVTFEPAHISIAAEDGETILQAQIRANLRPDAPCGGKGTCGKCKVLIQGETKLACQTVITEDVCIGLNPEAKLEILEHGISASVLPDAIDRFAIAFDIGTTTVVAFLLDGHTGAVLAHGSRQNPQSQYGSDVISRIEYAMANSIESLSSCIRTAMYELTADLCRQASIVPEDITTAAIVGNTAMHHLLLEIDPRPLITPPYMPAWKNAFERDNVRILPNIAGFVGGDTVACMLATRFDQLNELTLLIDIGTNGEMVLGNRERRIACSTAAGPAFEGAKISCGMRGAVGAVDHVWLENNSVQYHVIGDTKAIGLCGSGLLDLAAVLLECGVMDESGYLENAAYSLCDGVVLTQKDVRELQLAKAAIRAGIELLAECFGGSVDDIQRVYLAGAFGNFLKPESACRIGMIPPQLRDRIIPIGNAAGEGAKLCALRKAEFEYGKEIAEKTDFLELASMPQFQDRYVDALDFCEEEK